MTTTPFGLTEATDPSVTAYDHGLLSKYNDGELTQVGKVKQAAHAAASAEKNYRYEVIRLKLMLDGQDTSDGHPPGYAGTGGTSRFWEGARNGDFGSRLQVMADSGNRQSVANWLKANSAAARLLGAAVKDFTADLPLQAATDRGLEQSTLEKYGRMDPEPQETADLYFQTFGTLKGDYIQVINTLHTDYPVLVDDLREGIICQDLRFPEAVKELWRSHELAMQVQAAEERALEQAVDLAVAEENEESAATYVPTVEPEEHIGDQAPAVEDITVRKTPSKTWYKSDTGKLKVTEVVGELASPLPDLLNGLAGLSKKLDDQFAHASVMHNYTEFWAGYDKFFYSADTQRVKWGRGGRLTRMKKLRALMLEVAGKLDVYITGTTPPENVEYPEAGS
jgi:hypothetical protein